MIKWIIIALLLVSNWLTWLALDQQNDMISELAGNQITILSIINDMIFEMRSK